MGQTTRIRSATLLDADVSGRKYDARRPAEAIRPGRPGDWVGVVAEFCMTARLLFRGLQLISLRHPTYAESSRRYPEFSRPLSPSGPGLLKSRPRRRLGCERAD